MSRIAGLSGGVSEAFSRAGAKPFMALPNLTDGRLIPLFPHVFFMALLINNRRKSAAAKLADKVFGD
jgi:hypothetical protein